MKKPLDRFVSAAEDPQPNYVWIIDTVTGHARQVGLYHARESLELLNHFNAFNQLGTPSCTASK